MTERDLGVTIPMMKASHEKLGTGDSERSPAVKEENSACRAPQDETIDIPLLEDSLTKTPWERMQANDDAVRFADSLRAALKQHDAESERTDAEAR